MIEEKGLQMTNRIFKLIFAGMVLALTIPAFLTSCESDEPGIPDCAVYIRRNIDTYKLFNYGSYLYINKRELEKDRIGYGGILVIKGALEREYYAFDIACTNEKDASICIGKPGETLICTCESCGEQYDLNFGNGIPTKKISKLPLKRYSVSIDDYNYLIVTP